MIEQGRAYHRVLVEDHPCLSFCAASFSRCSVSGLVLIYPRPRAGCVLVELAVQGRQIAVQIDQEQAVRVGIALYLEYGAPLLQAAVDGGEVTLAQLVRLCSNPASNLQVSSSNGAAAG